MKEYVESQIESSSRATYVESTFANIAGRYDVMNKVMTGGQDRRWRAITVAETRLRPGGSALDVATGTGELAFALSRVVGPEGRVVGIDFTEGMLEIARHKGGLQPFGPEFRWGDALDLAFDEATFDAATIGFGLRNVVDVPQALHEMQRVLKPGGRMVCLEITKPRVPLLAAGFYAYFENVVPIIGALINGSREAYTYLPTSLQYFPDASALREMMLEAGFRKAHVRLLNFGTIAVHVGLK